MEWLSRWWKDLFRDVALTGSGLAIIGTQVTARQPDPYLIGAGLALTAPSTWAKIREIAAPPAPPEPSGPRPPSRPGDSPPTPSHAGGGTSEQ